MSASNNSFWNTPSESISSQPRETTSASSSRPGYASFSGSYFSSGNGASTTWSNLSDAFEDDEIKDDDNDDEFEISKPEGTLFLIDASLSARKNHHFTNLLEIVVKAISRKIIISPIDKIGVVFYNTASSKNNLALAAIEIFCPVQDPGIDLVEGLKTTIQHPESIPPGPPGSAKLSDVFWTASSIFAKNANQISPHIILLSIDPNPFAFQSPGSPLGDLAESDAEFRKTKLKISDLYERFTSIDFLAPNIIKNNPIWTSLFSQNDNSFSISHISKDNLTLIRDQNSFDPNTTESQHPHRLFDLTNSSMPGTSALDSSLSTPGYGFSSFDGVNGDRSSSDGLSGSSFSYSYLDDLSNDIMSRIFKKRTSGTVHFSLENNSNSVFNAAFKCYSLYSSQNRPQSKLYQVETTKPIITRHTNTCDTTGKELTTNDIIHYANFGGKKLIFTPEQWLQIRALKPKGIYYIGSRSFAKFPYHNLLGHPILLSPDDSTIKGSSVFSKSLYFNLLTMKKYLLVCFVFRNGLPPKICAMLPSIEDENIGPCFTLTELCYVDGHSSLPLPESFRLPKFGQVVAIREALKPLVLPNFSVSNYRNPALQAFYSMLQSLALSQGQVIPDCDLIPNPQAVELTDKKANTFANETDLILRQDQETTPSSSKSKSKSVRRQRSRESHDDDDYSASSSTTRQRKKKNTLENTTLDRVIEMSEAGKINKLKVSELKAFLTSQNVRFSSSAKKSVLIDITTRFLVERETADS